MRVSPRIQLAIAAAAMVAAWVAIAALAASPALRPVLFAALFALAFGAYLGGLRAVLRAPPEALGRVLPAIVVVGALLRALAFPLPPSDDMSRYLFEGRAQALGANPYRDSPAALAREPALADDPYRATVNHPEWTAIYPPALLLWHRAAGELAYTPAALKASFLAAECVLLLLLLALLRARALPDARVLAYWWSPLPVAAIALEGHHEPVYLALLFGALLLATRATGPARSATVALATLAVLAKGFAVAALPALYRRVRLRHAVLALPIVAALYAPFASAGADALRSLLRFGTQLHYNDSLHALASWALAGLGVGSPLASRVAMGCAWLAFGGYVLARGPADPLRRAGLLLGALLLVLPTVHPWYVVAIVPFLCFFPWPGWVALSGTCALAYLHYAGVQQGGRWTESTALKWIEYSPLCAWLLWTLRGRVRAHAWGLRERAEAHA